jgi:adenylate cyclase
VATEIERKFLVTGDQWRAVSTGETICQGYVCADHQQSVRVRVAGSKAFLTLKKAGNGFSRLEFEYDIPLADAQEMLATMCGGRLVEKIRYTLVESDREWVVDVFGGENAGLVVAEVELDSEDQHVELPSWAGREVTNEPCYLNTNLLKRPYTSWSEAERFGRG